MDNSAGVSESQFDDVKNIALQLLKQMQSSIENRDIEVGAVTTSGNVRVEFTIGEYTRYNDIRSALTGIRFGGRSPNSLYDALSELQLELFPKSGRVISSYHLVIIISNGGDVPNETELRNKVEAMSRDGYVFYTVYLSRNAGYRMIREFATDGKYNDFGDIVNDGNYVNFISTQEEACSKFIS